MTVFLPSFVLVLAAAPWFGRLRARAWFVPALHGAMLSFVGLLVFVTGQFAGGGAVERRLPTARRRFVRRATRRDRRALGRSRQRRAALAL
jgi:hypothetical protein